MIEKEYKVLLTEEQYKLIDAGLNWERAFTQINYYYNDKDNFIIKNDITLRIREKNKCLYLQSKIPCKQISSLSIKEEKELQINQIYDVIPNEIIFDLLGVKLKEIKQIGSLVTLRKQNLTLDKSIEICLDKNEYLGIVDYELELEYTSDSINEDIINFFTKKFNVDFSKTIKGKNKRFIGRLKGYKNEKNITH